MSMGPAGVGRASRESPLDHPGATFRADLVRSARAWVSAPALVVLTLGLWLGYAGIDQIVTSPGAREGVRFLTLPIGLFWAGFTGTQRIWYLRLFRGKSLRPGELLPITYAFIGRMVVLGLVTFGVLGVALIGVAGITMAREASRGVGTPHLPAFFLGAVAVCVLVLDIALTFVVPALAFSTRSVRDALGRGLSMIRDTWPSSAWYVLTPGLTLSALGFALPRSAVGPWGRELIGMVGALLALLFKGAVVAFYLRHHPEVGDHGAMR